MLLFGYGKSQGVQTIVDFYFSYFFAEQCFLGDQGIETSFELSHITFHMLGDNAQQYIIDIDIFLCDLVMQYRESGFIIRHTDIYDNA
jgi:hypothetical protein